MSRFLDQNLISTNLFPRLWKFLQIFDLIGLTFLVSGIVFFCSWYLISKDSAQFSSSDFSFTVIANGIRKYFRVPFLLFPHVLLLLYICFSANTASWRCTSTSLAFCWILFISGLKKILTFTPLVWLSQDLSRCLLCNLCIVFFLFGHPSWLLQSDWSAVQYSARQTNLAQETAWCFRGWKSSPVTDSCFCYFVRFLFSFLRFALRFLTNWYLVTNFDSGPKFNVLIDVFGTFVIGVTVSFIGWVSGPLISSFVFM